MWCDIRDLCPALVHSAHKMSANPTSWDSLTVLDSEGQVVSLSSLWTDTTAILVFLRHFG